jgi:alpha-D-ribose 1-methylphosphonate 5-triphosphate synthase subunit PhnH
LILQEGQNLLLPGFSDPVLDSQRTFRTLLDAMSRPGKVLQLEVGLEVPRPLHIAAGAVALTLFDFETPLWTDLETDSEAVNWIRFHCGCPVTADPHASRFALIMDENSLPPMGRFHLGLDECPEESTTLIIQVDKMVFGCGKRLMGPGIQGEHFLEAEGLPEDFWPAWENNHLAYPQGVDVILTAGKELAALPRTTRVE